MAALKRRPKLKQGQLRVYFGKDDDGEGHDVCFSWGAGCSKRDSALLHYHFATDRLDWQQRLEPSLIKQLEARGYDISTISFTIQKKAQQP